MFCETPGRSISEWPDRGHLVSTADARWLIEQLRVVGRADDVTAAHAIERAIRRLASIDDLTVRERDAILFALVDPPAGLVTLRGQLASQR